VVHLVCFICPIIFLKGEIGPGSYGLMEDDVLEQLFNWLYAQLHYLNFSQLLVELIKFAQ